jgi:hypothetical protein
MDELALLAEMRQDVPADMRYDAALHALNAEIIAGGTRRSLRRPVLLSTILAGAVAAASVVAITELNSGNDRHAPPAATSSRPALRLVAVTSPLTLADNAAVVASGFPVPSPHQWIYTKVESTTSHAPPSGAMKQDPGTHQIKEEWIQVDFQAFASISHGKLAVTQQPGGMGTPYGWPEITYKYLTSLPTDPAALLAQLRHNLATEPNPDHGQTGDAYVFQSILALVENYRVLPPKLNAALYGVLARLKTVRLGHTKDIAGRSVLSLYQIDEGYLKDEILINPTTYAYAGQKITVVRSHSNTALDGTQHFRKGEILDDEAILASKIVNSPGAR